jgi:hypothetical protein
MLACAGRGLQPRDRTPGLEAILQELVVLDLELPVVSGFRLLHLLKRGGAGTAPLGDGEGPTGYRSGTPVLVLAALSWEEAWEAVCDGAEDVPRTW